MRTLAYYIGGPRDGEMVHESLLTSGPRITVPVPEPLQPYWTPGSAPTMARTHTYRESPPCRVGDVATFRFFISESFGSGDSLNAIVSILTTAMEHRRWSRRGGAS